MAKRDPLTLVRNYEQGDVTEMEVTVGLVQAAVAASPETIAADLPPLFIHLLRDWSESPPSSFEQTPRTFRMGSYMGPCNDAEERANERWLTFEGLWRWHRYFQSQTG